MFLKGVTIPIVCLTRSPRDDAINDDDDDNDDDADCGGDWSLEAIDAADCDCPIILHERL